MHEIERRIGTILYCQVFIVYELLTDFVNFLKFKYLLIAK